MGTAVGMRLLVRYLEAIASRAWPLFWGELAVPVGVAKAQLRVWVCTVRIGVGKIPQFRFPSGAARFRRLIATGRAGDSHEGEVFAFLAAL